MKTLLALCLAATLASGTALAAERIDLSSPDQAKPGTSTYQITMLTLNWKHGRIVVRLEGGGLTKDVVFGDAENARAMMRSLNKANLSTKSLHRRIMERLISGGHLTGAISGIPD